MTLYLGMMSGTSMDGIDAALLEIGSSRMNVQAAHNHAWPGQLQQRLRHAAEHSEHTGLRELGELDTAVGLQFAQAAVGLLRSAGISASQVRAIGSHGQTLLHQPAGEARFTLQIGDPNIIAERLGIDVIADFRRRDLAAGGQGAPLMPAFHAAVFAAPGQLRAVVNIGGIANVTVLMADGGVIGFDTGPGNCLLDAWSRRHLREAYDAGGAWAASGAVDQALLAQLLALPYFARSAPKSTGRDTFSDQWLEGVLAGRSIRPVDAQSTLSELTARSIADALLAAAGTAPREIYVCGGGAFNAELMRRLGEALPQARISTTEACGIAPEHVEAAGFAWLAHRYLNDLPGNLPSVTGARRPVPLGALYRGGTV